LSLHPSTTTTIAEQLGADAPACIDAAIAKCTHELRPVPFDADERREWTNAIDERLRRLAVKVLPTARAADTKEWRDALADALSDLPAMIALTAAKRAIHRPFRFIGEIEMTVREIAAELIKEREERLAGMRRHREAIDRALNPPAPMLAAPVADPAPPSAEKVAFVNDWMRRHGLETRFAEDGSTYQDPPVSEAA
jgi:predicted trehalose synthase